MSLGGALESLEAQAPPIIQNMFANADFRDSAGNPVDSGLMTGIAGMIANQNPELLQQLEADFAQQQPEVVDMTSQYSPLVVPIPDSGSGILPEVVDMTTQYVDQTTDEGLLSRLGGLDLGHMDFAELNKKQDKLKDPREIQREQARLAMANLRSNPIMTGNQRLQQRGLLGAY